MLMAATMGTVLLAIGLGTLIAAAVLAAPYSAAESGAGVRSRRARAVRGCAWGACVLLAACLALMTWCLLSGDLSVRYAVYYRSDSTSELAWLYKLSGLWGGREGSLLLWSWLEALAGAALLTRPVRTKEDARLNGTAAALLLVLAALFTAVVLLVPGNQLFAPLPSEYLDGQGGLAGQARLWGLSSLLEHWAMVVHPPLLFVGYAGMTVPAACGTAALLVGDFQGRWMGLCRRWALVGWLFLSAGIGMGAVWAYTVLGWGGFWGWDPVENASLLPWLAGVVLVHNLVAYRRRRLFPRWILASALIAASFVMFAAFVTRSGIIGSVHAFDGDAASAWLFGLLAVVPLGFGLVLLWRRRNCFGEAPSIGDLASKGMLLYLNDLVVLGFAILLAYLVLCPALPAPLPFAGRTFSADAYAAIAGPLGVVYLALAALSPLMGWGRTDRAVLRARVFRPLVMAIVIFSLRMVNFFVNLLPVYEETLAAGGAAAEALLSRGPAWYYHGVAVGALAVASLLFATAAFSLVRRLRKGHRLAALGAPLAHGALALILVGLVGSTMYVSSVSAQLPYDEEANTASGTVEIGDWELAFEDVRTVIEENRTDLFSTASFAVWRDGRPWGTIAPAVQLIATTQQHQLHAAVVSTPLEDLFVTYQGVEKAGDEAVLVLDVSVHPLVAFLWAGFGLLLLGIALSCGSAARGGRSRAAGESSDENGGGGNGGA